MDDLKRGRWSSGAKSIDDWMVDHRTVVSASTASLVSTWTGFPLDSLKSRLQSSREPLSIPRLAADVIREEGVMGLWRGSLLPLITIATVRTISFTIYSNTKRFINPLYNTSAGTISRDGPSTPSTIALGSSGSSSSSDPNPYALSILTNPSIISVAGTSLVAGAASGAVVCMGSCPFELVKVRRQLEYQIARERREVEFRKASASPAAVEIMGGMIANRSAGERNVGVGGQQHQHHQSHGYDMVGQGDGEAQSGEEVKRAEAQQKVREAREVRDSNASANAKKMSGVSAVTGEVIGGEASTSSAMKSAASGMRTGGVIESANASATRGDLMAGWKPPSTMEAVRDIHRQRGIWGLWTGFRLHAVRDTLGTSLYFAEYDTFRYVLGRDPRTDKQGPIPDWAGKWLPQGLIPFVCGSVAGVTSWALIYPVDAIKTKTQQRVLTGLPARPALVQLTRLLRGKDPNDRKPLLVGVRTLYRGLGISMLRSILNHGLLWTMVDAMSQWVDNRPFERYAATG